MQYLASLSSSFVLAAVIAIVLFILLLLEFYNSIRASKIAYPMYEYAMKRAENEAVHIVEEARKEARQILDAAQAESLRIAEANKGQDQTVQREYHQALQASLEGLESHLKESTKAAEDAQARIASALAEELHAQGEAARMRMAASLDTLGKENARRIDEHLTQAFTAAEKEAQDYEHARKEVVDARIFSLLDETMRIVLHQSLPAAAHAELVRAALEEAKANKVF